MPTRITQALYVMALGIILVLPLTPEPVAKAKTFFVLCRHERTQYICRRHETIPPSSKL